MRQIPLFKVAMNPNLDDELLRVIHSGWIGQGGMVNKFEKELSKLYDHPRVLTLSAGTHGLSLALRLIGVGVGDEVITTPLTCTATNMPILNTGAKIVWADVKKDFNIDPKSIKENITDKTKAIVVVHWGGYPCDMSEIGQISHDTGIPIIEDCAHVLNATYKNQQIGDTKWSKFAMFSFQAIKHLTAIDGGALCVENFEDYKRGKLLRWYGIDRETERTDFRCEEDIKEGGYKYHMNDVNATVGLCNMPVALENEKKAQDNARHYECDLDTSGIELTQMETDRESSYWLFTMLVEKRSDFCAMMASKGIAVSRVHERNDKHTCFKESMKELPCLESIIDKMICIPVGWWVTQEDREYIIECIKRGW